MARVCDRPVLHTAQHLYRHESEALLFGQMGRQQVSRFCSQLYNALPELPTRQLLWVEPSLSAKAQEQILPYTAPISRWRGRHLAERLQLRLPTPPAAEASLVDGKELKTSCASLMQLRYPLSAHSQTASPIHQQYLHPLPANDQRSTLPASVRGLWMYNKHLLLEDLDTFAADVAFRHAGGPGVALVTAHLESLVWYQHLYPCSAPSASASHQNARAPHPPPHAPSRPDIFMTGQVTWVGNSTLEVTLEITQGDPNEVAGAKGQGGHRLSSQHQDVALIARARFVMAAREPCMKKAARVPRLVCINEHEKHLAVDGTARNDARHDRRKQGHSPALTHQAEHLLSSVVKSLPANGANTPSALDTAPLVWEHKFITSNKDVNTTGTLFGGQLLRFGMEAGEAAAAQYTGGPCELLAMRDVPFKALVHLGDHMHVHAQVVASHHQLLAVHVVASRLPHHHAPQAQGSSTSAARACRGGEAALHQAQSKDEVVTNEYWCVFEAPRSQHVRTVLPRAEDHASLLLWSRGIGLCKEFADYGCGV